MVTDRDDPSPPLASFGGEGTTRVEEVVLEASADLDGLRPCIRGSNNAKSRLVYDGGEEGYTTGDDRKKRLKNWIKQKEALNFTLGEDITWSQIHQRVNLTLVG